MAAITNDKGRYQIFARCPKGKPELADRLILIGVVQCHGFDKEIEERRPWAVEEIPLNWFNQRRMAPLVDPEHVDELSCLTHAATRLRNCGPILSSGLLTAGGDSLGGRLVA